MLKSILLSSWTVLVNGNVKNGKFWIRADDGVVTTGGGDGGDVVGGDGGTNGSCAGGGGKGSYPEGNLNRCASVNGATQNLF
jgi:hypothetical protein